jgi:mono/diheme cytochrome c family protein
MSLSRKGIIIAGIVVIGAATIGYLRLYAPEPAIIADDGTEAPLVNVAVPELAGAAVEGRALFEANCAACHGKNAAGKDGFGPPLVHKIYEPGHHADVAFQMAVANGVRAHHWRFGDMPAVQGVTQSDVDKIVAYVRALQRENGIF